MRKVLLGFIIISMFATILACNKQSTLSFNEVIDGGLVKSINYFFENEKAFSKKDANEYLALLAEEIVRELVDYSYILSLLGDTTEMPNHLVNVYYNSFYNTKKSVLYVNNLPGLFEDSDIINQLLINIKNNDLFALHKVYKINDGEVTDYNFTVGFASEYIVKLQDIFSRVFEVAEDGSFSLQSLNINNLFLALNKNILMLNKSEKVNNQQFKLAILDNIKELKSLKSQEDCYALIPVSISEEVPATNDIKSLAMRLLPNDASFNSSTVDNVVPLLKAWYGDKIIEFNETEDIVSALFTKHQLHVYLDPFAHGLEIVATKDTTLRDKIGLYTIYLKAKISNPEYDSLETIDNISYRVYEYEVEDYTLRVYVNTSGIVMRIYVGMECGG